jgi:hypothetical protein
VKWPILQTEDSGLEMMGRIRAFGYDGVVAAFDAGPQAQTSAWEDWVPQTCGRLANAIGPGLALMAVGGVTSAPRALALWRAGAQLVQMYRGFVDAGPELVREVGRALDDARAASPASALPLAQVRTSAMI